MLSRTPSDVSTVSRTSVTVPVSTVITIHANLVQFTVFIELSLVYNVYHIYVVAKNLSLTCSRLVMGRICGISRLWSYIMTAQALGLVLLVEEALELL